MVKRELESHKSDITAAEDILNDAAARVAANKLVTGATSLKALENAKLLLELKLLQQQQQTRMIINKPLDDIKAYEDYYENGLASLEQTLHNYHKISASLEKNLEAKSKAESIYDDTLKSHEKYKKIHEDVIKSHDIEMDNLKKQRNWLAHASASLLEKIKIKNNESIEEIFKSAYLKSKK